MSLHGARVKYFFGHFECDAVAYELRRRGRRTRLAGQPLDLLLLLLQRRGELVSREEIASHLWRESVFVDVDAGIRTAILKIRQALDDSGESPRFVETVHGKGYRFIAPVEVAPVAQSQPAAPQTAFQPPAAIRRHNLPADLTSFVGREESLAELRRLLSTSRLLSLTGPGGAGKTRLALRLAAGLIDEFTGGVWLVDLSSLAAPDLIPQSVATIFGVRESPQRSVRDALVDYLRDRELLLLFDTCEHLIDACAELAETLLGVAPGLRIVTTSQEALRVPGEVVYRVPPLSVPDGTRSCSPAMLGDFEATQLFVQRAQAVQPDFRVPPDVADPIAAICRRLDGIPLAIELAAAQVAFLSPSQIELHLSNGFRTMGNRTSVLRQRTIDTTVSWSYQLLSDGERLLFNRLSVFPGSWTLEASEHVCSGDGLDPAQVMPVLSRLVNKSLIHVESDGPAGRRYRLLETMRQHAHERLVEVDRVSRLRDRHFVFVHQQFRDGLRTLTGPDQAHGLRRLRIEQENVRAALDWGLCSPTLAAQGVELAAALFWYWTKRGLFAEGRQWLERAAGLQAPGVLTAWVALGLGHMAYFQGRHAEMTARNNEVVACGRDNGDGRLVAFGLFGHGLAQFESGAFDEAVASALAARDAAGQDFTPPLLILGNVAIVEGDHQRALTYFDDAIEGHRRVGEIWGLGILLSLAAGLRILRGDFDAARGHAAEALSIYRDLEDPRGIAWSLDMYAGLLAAQGDAEQATRMWGASDALLDSVGGTLVPTIGWIRDRYLEPARVGLGESSFERAREQGRRLPVEHVMALAFRDLGE